MTMKYGYIRANRELSDDYVSLDTIEYSKIDIKYIPVFENSDKNTIRICRRKNKVLLTATSPKPHTEGHPFPFLGNDKKRYTLIRNFSDRLEKGDTVMFSSILDLSENEAEAVSIYHLFWNKGIYLKFIDTQWLDTQMYDALSQQVPEMIFPLIDTQIGVTFRRLALSHDRKQNTEVSQLNQEYKKN